MRLYRPKSIRRLLLVGFVLVVIPLIMALIHAMYSVDQLVVQGQRALFATVRATHGSEQLANAITDMERNALQYKVLGDGDLLDVYHENRQQFLQIAKRLARLNLSAIHRERLDMIVEMEGKVNHVLNNLPYDVPETARAVENFSSLASEARKILDDNRELVKREVAQLEANGVRVQRDLMVHAMALVPAAMILTAIFAILITRPIQQMDQAIRRLGEGDFSRPARIKGPQDLEQLGKRLDWMRTRLLEVDQDKNRFLNHISHELKTPLTAIREATELLNEGVTGSLNTQQGEIVEILRDKSIQLQSLIEDLLDFNIASSRDSQLRVEHVSLRPLIESVLADHRVAALARQLRLEISLQSVEIEGDHVKLRTLIDNLVSNAIKFSPEQGHLRIRLEQQGEQAVIEVADSGPGIPEEERRRVFDAFYQGASSTGVQVRGTGLGLSIAREYALAHKGYIEVINSEGPGACLRVILPIKISGTRHA
jgi:two-component system sensor histidine kinase GlrK